MLEAVAESTSRWGGRCTECHVEIEKGERILKVPTEGKTTAHGQGPGRWVCTGCGQTTERDDPQGVLL